MAKGVMRTAGIGACGFALALMIGEARNPGSAADTTSVAVNGAVPVLRGGGVLAGETMGAAAPAMQGAREALNGLGDAVGTSTEATLPVTPLAGSAG